jgi:hypothetical protein
MDFAEKPRTPSNGDKKLNVKRTRDDQPIKNAKISKDLEGIETRLAMHSDCIPHKRIYNSFYSLTFFSFWTSHRITETNTNHAFPGTQTFLQSISH